MSNIYYPEHLGALYAMIREKLDSRELLDLLCFLDDGLTDDIIDLLADDCKIWFPELFDDDNELDGVK